MPNKVKYHLDNNFLESPRKFGSIYVVQAGRMFLGEHRLFGEHPHHNWFELTIVNKGNAVVLTNGVPTPVKSGDIYFSFPDEMHGIETTEDSALEYDFYSFYTEDDIFNAELNRIRKEYSSADKRVFHDENVNSLVLNLIGEFVGGSPVMKERAITSIVEQITIYVIRCFSANKSGKTYKNINNRDIFCYHLMNYIDENIYLLKDLNSLEKVFNYNYSYISDVFSKTTGRKLSEYFKDMRMNVAKTLLTEGKLSVNEISSELNYSSVYSFSKAFKEKFGVSPSSFKPNKTV